MLETAIIGGGLCGLALARQLEKQGRSFTLFEARARLGGRILTAVSATTGEALDLGPTWFWPETQPLISAFVSDLGLATFPQHDDGVVLHLTEADKSPRGLEQSVHGGARRVAGGVSRIIATLAEGLAEERLRLGHVLAGVEDKGDHVALTFRVDDTFLTVEARQVVIALPPRLVAETVRFTPELDAPTRDAMAAAPTWMAAQAKVVMSYASAFWREAGQSGNAFVTHEQAVVGEIFDACDATGSKAALGGFLSFPPDLREAFIAGLPMLMDSQMVQVFGSAADGGEQHYQDWAQEAFTCSSRDNAEPQAEHVAFSNPLLRRSLWDGRLHLGGSETATQGAGYLEGALEAARRIDRALARLRAAEETDGGVSLPEGLSVNAASLARFAAWVAAQNDAAFEAYRVRLNRALATQQREQLTQRAMLGAIEDIYERAADMLDTLPFDMREVPVEKGRSALMSDVQLPFRDFIQTLLDDIIAFNRTSCALSNFPGEHHLSKDYVQTILRDVAAAWRDFCLAANRRLLAKAEAGAAGGASLPPGGGPILTSAS